MVHQKVPKSYFQRQFPCFFQEETTPCKVSVTLTQTSEAAPVNMKASGAYYAGGEDLTLLTSQVSNCFDINLMTVST